MRNTGVPGCLCWNLRLEPKVQVGVRRGFGIEAGILLIADK